MIIGVHTGSVFACLLTTTGQIYSFGKAAFTGHGEREDTYLPRRIEHALLEECVIQVTVATEGFHTMALTANQKLFAWGHNRVGQLGIRSHSYNNTGGGEEGSDILMERNEDGGYYQPIPRQVILPSTSSAATAIKQVTDGVCNSSNCI